MTATKTLSKTCDAASQNAESLKEGLVDNLALWNKVKTTDLEMSKKVKYGKREFTAIDPQWQLMQATKLWGPYGKDWGLENLNFELVMCNTVTSREGEDEKGKFRTVDESSEPVLTLHAVFRYPEGQFEIANDMKFRPGDDTYKKLLTNTRSKALSYLGFSADVYMGMFDDDDYIRDLKVKQDEFDSLKIKVLSTIKMAKTDKELDGCEKRLLEMVSADTIDGERCKEFLVEIKKRRAELEAK